MAGREFIVAACTAAAFAAASHVAAEDAAVSPLRPGAKAGDEWVNGAGMVFCWCPPGKFMMGSPPAEPGRFPDEALREVTIADGFWLGKYEVTRHQAHTIDRPRSKHPLAKHDDDPVDGVHFDDMRHFIRRLEDHERKAGHLPADWQYGFPTEAQWEYACRAGTTTRFFFGDDAAQLPIYANFADRSLFGTRAGYRYADRKLDDGHAWLSPVGSYKPNPWGLHDMYGNLWEMCEGNVARGGAWCSPADYCRSASRQAFASRVERPFLGYRVILRKRGAAGK